MRESGLGGVDDAVVSAAKQGDPAAWRELYAAVGGRLFGWLKAQAVADPAFDADDLANEAWLTAARRISEFSGDTDDFAGWVFVIARNLTVNANRRSNRRATTPTDLDPRELVTQSSHTDDHTGEVDARDWIARLLTKLTDRERDVVACIDIAGLDIETTSRVLGLSRPAVRVAHHRAMKRLRAAVSLDDAGLHP